jgi:hypothetical protein
MWVSGIADRNWNLMGFPVHRFGAALLGMIKKGMVLL